MSKTVRMTGDRRWYEPKQLDQTRDFGADKAGALAFVKRARKGGNTAKLRQGFDGKQATYEVRVG